MEICIIGFQLKIINMKNDNNGPSYWSLKIISRKRERGGGEEACARACSMCTGAGDKEEGREDERRYGNAEGTTLRAATLERILRLVVEVFSSAL